MRNRNVAIAIGTILAVTAAIGPARAITDPGDRGADPDTSKVYDVRADADPVAPTKDQVTAANQLAAEAGGARISWDRRFGTPRMIRRDGGALSKPRDGSPADVAKAWLGGHRTVLGMSKSDVSALRLTGSHKLPDSSLRVVQFAQTFDGVETVRGGRIGVLVDGAGRVWSYTGGTARHAELTKAWRISSVTAIDKVAAKLAPKADYTPKLGKTRAGYDTIGAGPFAAPSYVKKVTFPTADGAVPAYRVLFVKRLSEAYDVVVDGASGEVLYRTSVVDHEAEGTVYKNHPGAKQGGTPEIVSFGPNDQSPSGWVDPSGVAGLPGPTTFGNNANSYANYSNFLVPADQGPRPVSATSQFNYAYANNWGRSKGELVPPSYAKDLNPATTNLFYHHNRIHDELYALGFTESAGNFQVNNGGAGGEGHDPILGLVHAGAATGGAPTYTGRDNAYMLTLPDGLPSWSGMFLWEPIDDAFEGPYADGNFDASVIEHEYVHGLSNRYVSPEDGALGAHQSGSMGEGWSDWYALNYLAGNGLDNSSVVGKYVTGNNERGIRSWAYDDDPTTYGDIGFDLVGAEVHADGSIWTAILWQMRKALVAKYGQTEGGQIAAHIVTDGMPLTPADPSFIDARDGILTALDARYHSRSDYSTIADIVYAAFAKRGLGLHASTEGGGDTDPVPSFTHRKPSRNGILKGKVINASTNKPVANARIMIGEFEARVSPLRKTGDTGRFAAPVTAGSYPVTVAAPGFGSRTFSDIKVTAGDTTSLKFTLAPNLASKANGAEVVKSSDSGANKLIDDTEASSWTAAKGDGNAVIKLAKEAEISSVQVSAYTTSRFEGLRSFTVQTSTDGVNWETTLAKPDAFSYAKPRPVAPDLHYKTFTLDSPVRARYVRFWTDAPLGNTKNQVQAAELQVFSSTATGVKPLPPEPPDEPVTDTGTIATGNPSTGSVDDATGVTANDFKSTCSVPPASQGADGWVTELPDSFGDGVHKVTVAGESAATYDIDLYFYDKDCNLIGSAASSAADESASIPGDTKYVLSQLWLGAAVDITLTATDTA